MHEHSSSCCIIVDILVKEKDVHFLVRLIGNCAYKWKEICGQCGLLPDEIEAIARDPLNVLTGGNIQCLTAGLSRWCNISPMDGQHSSTPTLDILVKAIRSPVVNKGALADDVWARRHELPSLSNIEHGHHQPYMLKLFVVVVAFLLLLFLHTLS